VATADREQLDVLLAIGIKPVMYGRSGDYPEPPPWIGRDRLAGLTSKPMLGSFEPDLEAIAAARPDLIVDAWADGSVHAGLNRIAPTVEVKLDPAESWQDAQRLAGKATGRDGAAEAAIASTEEVLGDQRERLAPFAGMSVALAFVDGSELVMIPGNEIGGRCLSQLGVTVHPTPDGKSGRYSLERIGELLEGADAIVSFDYGALDVQEANPLFKRLPAVRSGRYFVLPTEISTACYQESTLQHDGPERRRDAQQRDGRGRERHQPRRSEAEHEHDGRRAPRIARPEATSWPVRATASAPPGGASARSTTRMRISCATRSSARSSRWYPHMPPWASATKFAARTASHRSSRPRRRSRSRRPRCCR
jgi:ABC-type Fe3+-hydroxamate transport system substrate-binding protein